jgi:hypothetical protein
VIPVQVEVGPGLIRKTDCFAADTGKCKSQSRNPGGRGYPETGVGGDRKDQSWLERGIGNRWGTDPMVDLHRTN